MHPVIKLISLSSFFISVAVQAQSCEQTAQLINQRLAYMKDVAGYKAINHLPIEDLHQEDKVINQSLAEAEALGLQGSLVRPFMVAQINAAKAIQYRYRADWLSQPEPDWQPKPLNEIRPHISELSSNILRQAAQELHSGKKRVACDKTVFLKTIRQHNLQDADVELIFSTFNQMTLK